MITINPTKSGLALGVLLGLCHAFWAALVAFGGTGNHQFRFLDSFHKADYVIKPFNVGLALALVSATTTIGFAVGYIFALIWNLFHR